MLERFREQERRHIAEMASAGIDTSEHRSVNETWRSRCRFQACYGLRVTPEDLEEGEAILERSREQDMRGIAEGQLPLDNTAYASRYSR